MNTEKLKGIAEALRNIARAIQKAEQAQEAQLMPPREPPPGKAWLAWRPPKRREQYVYEGEVQEAGEDHLHPCWIIADLPAGHVYCNWEEVRAGRTYAAEGNGMPLVAAEDKPGEWRSRLRPVPQFQPGEILLGPSNALRVVDKQHKLRCLNGDSWTASPWVLDDWQKASEDDINRFASAAFVAATVRAAARCAVGVAT